MDKDKKQVDEKIADALGINFTPEEPSTTQKSKEVSRTEITPISPQYTEIETQDIDPNKPIEERLMEIDFLHGRTRLKRLLERGEEMFEDSYRIAQETDGARSYEVAGQLLKTILDANKDLAKLHSERAKTRREVLGKEESAAPTGMGSNNNINVFTGTTAELLDAIIEKNPKRDVINEANPDND